MSSKDSDDFARDVIVFIFLIMIGVNNIFQYVETRRLEKAIKAIQQAETGVMSDENRQAQTE